MQQTEYETVRRTTVRKSNPKKPQPTVIHPWPDPNDRDGDIVRLGHPGGAKGMLDLIYTPETDWVILDGCVPSGVARMIRAAYEVLTV